MEIRLEEQENYIDSILESIEDARQNAQDVWLEVRSQFINEKHMED